MKNWKAAIITWERREKTRTQAGSFRDAKKVEYSKNELKELFDDVENIKI